MPQTVLSDQERMVSRGAVLAYAAAQAVATNQPRVAVSGLLLSMQTAYNSALPLYRTIWRSPGIQPVRIDGAWGRQCARALYVMLGAAVGTDDGLQYQAVMDSALDRATDFSAIATVADLSSRFPRIRDAVTTFANQQHADGFRTVVQDAGGLIAVVNSAPTTADAGARVTAYLGSLWTNTQGVSVPTAQVVSTRTPPSTDLLKEATQTPSTTMNVDAPPMEFSVDEVDVYGRPTLRRANLAVIIPSVLVGALLLAWGVQKYQGRARR